MSPMSSLTRVLTDVATGPFFRTAEVAGVTPLSRQFRQIDLSGDALRGAKWAAGNKVQIRFGDGLTLRTFTPLRWDAVGGTASIAAFLHDSGPGSRLLAGIEAGAELKFFGPRSSIALADATGPAVFVGDETSIGLAVNRSETGQPTTWIFEATDPDDYRTALTALGLPAEATIVEVGEPLRAAAIAALRAAPADRLILTGRAQSIATLRALIKTESLGSRPTLVKAYWDEKRSGLD